MAALQKKTPSISIVIGTFNRPSILKSLLEELLTQSKDLPFEVIVIDQSDQKIYEENKKEFPNKDNFFLLRLQKPNTCKYLNMGWQKSNAPIVLYLDDDVSLTPKTIKAHVNCYKKPSVLAVAGRVMNDNEPISQSSQVGKILFFGAEITKNFSYDKEKFVDYPYGCNMSFRKEILEKLGGFDEKIQPPIYAYNELDLGLRITRKYPDSMVFAPDALVYHHQYKSGGTRAFDKKIYESAVSRNYGYFLGKNYNLFQNIICLFRRLPFQITKEPSKIKDILTGYFYAKK
jgi:glycosyltransferase involved in cell wall biosynthesis